MCGCELECVFTSTNKGPQPCRKDILAVDMDVKFLLGGKNFQPFSYIVLSHQLTRFVFYTEFDCCVSLPFR